jgi:mannosyl-oligosaccharide alpha-1,2-mannosidase
MSRLIRRWIFICLSAFLCLTIFYRIYNSEWEFSSFLWRTPNEVQQRIPWELRQEVFPLTSYIPLSTNEPAEIPDIQAVFPNESGDRKAWRLKRQQAVKDAFSKSWKAYEKYAWLQDEIMPISGQSKETFGGWGASLVDALDTLWIMGMEKEFMFAVAALHRIDFTRASRDMLNVFETTIRYLGGMLSAYDLSGGKYPVLLDKATELGDMLYAAFDTPNRMPVTRWYWKRCVLAKFLELMLTVAVPHSIFRKKLTLTLWQRRLVLSLWSSRVFRSLLRTQSTLMPFKESLTSWSGSKI